MSDDDPATPTKDDEVNFSDLYAALVEVFAVILLGYVIGRLKLIGATESKGLGRFASLIALPSVLFLNMSQLDFSAVNWWFILAILIAKTIIFVVVISLGFAIKRKSGIDRAALFAIFTTQSNDFAFGLPVVTSLFKSPASPGLSYGDYLFLIAPISFIFLNPIGFAMMEYGKNLKSENRKSGLKIAWIVFRGVITNPIVFMAIIGLVLNPIIKHKLPHIITPLFTVLKQAFDGVALFYLGMSMVGKFKRLPGFAILIPIFLITVKELICPLLVQQMVDALDSSGNLSNFGFLYGTFPTAPALLFYSQKYSLAADLIATSLVLCTLLSAPIIFISAHMISLTSLKVEQIENQLATSINYVSYFSLAGIIWLLFMFLLARRFKRIMFKIDMALLVLLFSGAFSVVLSQTTSDLCPDDPGVVTLFWFQLVGVLGSRLLATSVAVGLVIIHHYDAKLWRKIFAIMISISIGIPVIATTFLVSLGTVSMPDSNETCQTGNASFFYQHNGDGRFLFGTGQEIMSMVILVLCILLSLLSLTALARIHQKKRAADLQGKENNSSTTSVVLTSSSSSNETRQRFSSAVQESAVDQNDVTDTSNVIVAAEIVENDDKTQIVADDRRLSTVLTSSQTETDSNSLKQQLVVRHVIYILYSVVSMTLGVYITIKRFMGDRQDGVFYEVEFLDGALNFGQGFVLFALFGFDKYPVLVLLLRWIRRLLYDVESIHLPEINELDAYTLTVCTTFKDQYEADCKRDLCKDRKYRLRKYRKCLIGSDMVLWLTDEGIAEDHAAAVEYARTLLRGRVIQHVHQEHDFHDLGYFYEFCDDAKERKAKKKEHADPVIT